MKYIRNKMMVKMSRLQTTSVHCIIYKIKTIERNRNLVYLSYQNTVTATVNQIYNF